MAGFDLPARAIREQIASALDVVIQVARLSDGTRKVMQVAEIAGMEGEVVVMQDIFLFQRRGVEEGGRVAGSFAATGVRPRFLDAVEAAGIHLDPALFAPGTSRGKRGT